VSVASIRGGGHFAMRSIKATTAFFIQKFIENEDLPTEEFTYAKTLQKLNATWEFVASYEYNKSYNKSKKVQFV
jgi:hypothetical protein